MPSVGIRELKSQASEIIRHVKDQQAEYVVTYRGEPVAVLLPIDRQMLEANAVRSAATPLLAVDLEAEMAALRREIDESWQSEQTAVELIAGQRR